MLRTYDPKAVRIIIGGVPIGGFAAGTFLSLAMDEQAFTKETGADGETARAKSNNNGGTATITLMQTSPSNDVLAAIAQADRLLNAGVVPILIQDGSGRTTLFSATGWVQKQPDAAFGLEIEDREWVMDLSDVDYFVGGNPDVTPA
jgi:hypothetical protein